MLHLCHFPLIGLSVLHSVNCVYLYTFFNTRSIIYIVWNGRVYKFANGVCHQSLESRQAMLASRVCESSIKDIKSFTFRACTQFQLCVTTMIYVLYMPFFVAKKISPDVDCLLQFSSIFFFFSSQDV